jgi:polyhydroxyalkanoate synthesis regulator protein
MILESRGGGKLLPVPLLLQLLRLGDGMLADFFGKYLSWSLQTYMGMRSQASQMMPWNPLLAPGGAQAFARMVPGFMTPNMGGYGGMYDQQAPEPMAPGAVVPPPPPAPSTVDAAQGLEDLRRELEELKRSMSAPKPAPTPKPARKPKKPRSSPKSRA